MIMMFLMNSYLLTIKMFVFKNIKFFFNVLVDDLPVSFGVGEDPDSGRNVADQMLIFGVHKSCEIIDLWVKRYVD